jgi:Prokaryotic E2 family E
MALIPEDDIAYLDEKGLAYDLIQAAGEVHLILHRFPFPKYVPAEADVLIRIRAGYPQAALDMFFTIPDIKLPSGAFPDRCNQHPVIGGKPWQQWSRHTQWRAGVDSLRSFLAGMMREIDKGI